MQCELSICLTIYQYCMTELMLNGVIHVYHESSQIDNLLCFFDLSYSDLDAL